MSSHILKMNMFAVLHLLSTKKCFEQPSKSKTFVGTIDEKIDSFPKKYSKNVRLDSSFSISVYTKNTARPLVGRSGAST